MDPFDIWQRTQRSRLRRDKNLVFVMAGPPGVGKSTAAAIACRGIDKTFTLARACFSTGELSDLIETLRPGQAVLLDEPFRGADALDWNSPESKSFVRTLGVFRERNLALAIATPDWELLHPKVRSSFVDWRFDLFPGHKAVAGKRTLHKDQRGRRGADRYYYQPKFRFAWSDLPPETKAEYLKRKRAVTSGMGMDRAQGGSGPVLDADLMDRLRPELVSVRAWRPPVKEERRQGRPRGRHEEVVAEWRRFRSE